jgi:hypothetical protein
MITDIVLTAIEIGAGLVVLSCFAAIIWVIYDYIKNSK